MPYCSLVAKTVTLLLYTETVVCRFTLHKKVYACMHVVHVAVASAVELHSAHETYKQETHSQLFDVGRSTVFLFYSSLLFCKSSLVWQLVGYSLAYQLCLYSTTTMEEGGVSRRCAMSPCGLSKYAITVQLGEVTFETIEFIAFHSYP